ncbi:hypothetical protein BS50DRAFT_584228 [Corynespora cassiicola Philippines]|uniref:Uncharacterized protein n=1 Tax=Corynespora cassiicola Philippines TaxID=1448308 RepID=A0A2T2NYX6_CORCC|nr:hypothetical protein BS50DRAFT_584228 [Corynespora cassiicola Philippines]
MTVQSYPNPQQQYPQQPSQQYPWNPWQYPQQHPQQNPQQNPQQHPHHPTQQPAPDSSLPPPLNIGISYNPTMLATLSLYILASDITALEAYFKGPNINAYALNAVVDSIPPDQFSQPAGRFQQLLRICTDIQDIISKPIHGYDNRSVARALRTLYCYRLRYHRYLEKGKAPPYNLSLCLALAFVTSHKYWTDARVKLEWWEEKTGFPKQYLRNEEVKFLMVMEWKLGEGTRDEQGWYYKLLWLWHRYAKLRS